LATEAFAGAGQDRDVDGVIAGEGDEGVLQLAAQPGRERIHRLRPVQGDGGHPAIHFEQQHRVGHRTLRIT
jgi:hypothetical protein